MRTVRAALAGLMIVAAFTGPAAAENVLRWASAGGAATFDPHAYDAGPNFRQVWQVFETLVQPDFTTGKAFFPRLAVAWKPVNTTTMEVQVRQGVRFHDGTPLTVDDVVFSIHRAGSETSDLRGGLKNIVAEEAIDRRPYGS